MLNAPNLVIWINKGQDVLMIFKERQERKKKDKSFYAARNEGVLFMIVKNYVKDVNERSYLVE